MTIAWLASSVWVSHGISEITRLAPLTQSSCIPRLADTTDFSIPDIAAPGKVPVGLRTRTGLTAVRGVGIAVEALGTLITVITPTIGPTVLRRKTFARCLNWTQST